MFQNFNVKKLAIYRNSEIISEILKIGISTSKYIFLNNLKSSQNLSFQGLGTPTLSPPQEGAGYGFNTIHNPLRHSFSMHGINPYSPAARGPYGGIGGGHHPSAYGHGAPPTLDLNQSMPNQYHSYSVYAEQHIKASPMAHPSQRLSLYETNRFTMMNHQPYPL